MNDADTRQQTDRLVALRARWITPLGLGHWSIVIAGHRGALPPRDGDAPHEQGTVLFRCSVDWEYMQATIHADLSFVAEHDDDDLERHFVHELFHIVVAEMREWSDGGGMKHEERVVSWLTLIAFWLGPFWIDRARLPPTGTMPAQGID